MTDEEKAVYQAELIVHVEDTRRVLAALREALDSMPDAVLD